MKNSLPAVLPIRAIIDKGVLLTRAIGGDNIVEIAARRIL